MARPRKIDYTELELLEGRQARIRAQLDLLKMIQEWKEAVGTRRFHANHLEGVGIKGFAIMYVRRQWGLLYNDELVDRATMFIEGLEKLGIIKIGRDPNLPDCDKPEYRYVYPIKEALEVAETRIKNQA